jgi:leucyl-tRNA synthetase
MEHTTLHLLYSRFIYKFLYDIDLVPQKEPYNKRTCHGIVLAEDGRKMSKSFGNVINPDDIIKEFGADTLRIYEMFMGPFDQAISWDSKGVKGCYKFLNKIYTLIEEREPDQKSSKKVIKEINKLTKKIGEDLEEMKFNTSIAAFMEFINLCSKEEVSREERNKIIILLSPFAPHLAEELWKKTGHKESVSLEKWPKYKEELLKEDSINLMIQINGKLRDKMESNINISEEDTTKKVLKREKIKKWIQGKEIKKIIFVPGKLINIVI